MKDKKIIIVLVILIFITIIFDGILVLYSQKMSISNETKTQINNEIKYRCSSMLTIKEQYPSTVFDDYSFVYGKKENKILLGERIITTKYNDKNVYSSIIQNMKEERNTKYADKNTTYESNENDLTVVKKISIILNEEKIDYKKENWLENYIKNLDNYACEAI